MLNASRSRPLAASARRRLALAAAALLAAAGLAVPGGTVAATAAAAGVGNTPAGFTDEVVVSGSGCSSVAGSTRCVLTPTNIEFAPDGSLLVAEKRGVVKHFDGPADRSPDLVVDLRAEVYNSGDSGLLGMALDPQFPARPYLYVSYARDAPPGGTAPTWGSAGSDEEDCPETGEGCLRSGRVLRLTLDGWRATAQRVLVDSGSCHPYASHSVDDLQFGPDGALYLSTGDAAEAIFADYGQGGTNACDDPPTRVGTTPSRGTSEAGAFRSQDVRTPGDPTGLNGTLARIDPDTGAGLPDNPFASSGDENARRIAAYGLRNPFRFDFRPGSDEVYVADVGWNGWEEIDVVRTGDGRAENFGWPCYEGPARQRSYDGLDNALCESLYSAGTASAPFFAYEHGQAMPGGLCPEVSGSSLGGIAFYPTGGSFPDRYDGALFFADFARPCLMVMSPGADGRPDPATLTEFGLTRPSGNPNGPWPVDLEVSPSGDLWYADVFYNRLHRISADDAGGGTNRPPTAAVAADPVAGPAGTTVRFDGRGSRDPDGDPLAFAWDLDDDGAYDDATGPTASRAFPEAGRFRAGLRVTDPGGLSATASTAVEIGAEPTVSITVPDAARTWHVGERLALTGSATDASGQPVPADELRWSVALFHCGTTGCHPHPQTGGTGGDLVLTAPDHSAPAHLEVTLAATAADGSSGEATVRLDPDTVPVTLTTEPSGLELTLDADTVTGPSTRPEIVGSRHTVGAADQATADGEWRFAGWSDGVQSAVRDLVLGTSPVTLTARFVPADSGGVGVPRARAVNLGGGAMTILGTPWESHAAAGAVTDGTLSRAWAMSLTPRTSVSWSSLVRDGVSAPGGVSVTVPAVPAATYDVWVTTVEDGAPVVSDVVVEGTTVLAGHDSRGRGAWDRSGPFRVAVTGGSLELATTGDLVLAGVEILPVG